MTWIGLGVLLQLTLVGTVISALASNRADIWSEVAALSLAIAVLYPFGYPPAHSHFVPEPPSADMVRGALFILMVGLAFGAPKAPRLIRRLPLRDLLGDHAAPLKFYVLDVSAGLLLAPVAAIVGLLAMSVTCPVTLLALVFPPFMGIAIRYGAFGFVLLWPIFLTICRGFGLRLSETSIAFAIVIATTLLWWTDMQGEWLGPNGRKDGFGYYLMTSFWLGTTASAWWTARQHQHLIDYWRTSAG